MRGRTCHLAQLTAATLAIAMLAGCSSHTVDHGDSLPTSVAITALTHDALFVVNGGDNSLSVIDTGSDTVVATVRLLNAAWPHHIALSPDRTRLALGMPGIDLSAGHGGHGGHGTPSKGIVMVLDARTGATLRVRTLDAMNHNAAWSPDGSEIWTSSMTASGAVIVLDAATLETKRTISVGSMPAEVTFDVAGRYAFVANGGSATVSVMDRTSKLVVRTIAVGAEPVGAWPGSDSMMYVDNEAGRSITAIDVKTLQVVRTYDLGFTPAVATVGPDGSLWVADADAGRVVIYARGSTTIVGEIAVGAGAHAIVFAPGGVTAYVSNQRAGTVSVIDVPTRSVRRTIRVGTKPNGLVFVGR